MRSLHPAKAPLLHRPLLQALGLTTALLALGACSSGQSFDWDLRGGGLSTAEAARGAAQSRPTPDARGVISYPGYQVAVARRGDTVATLAARVGVSPAELASYNATRPDAALRDGEVIALPRRVPEQAGSAAIASPGAVVGAPIRSGAIDVTTIAGTAINRAAAPAATGTPPTTAPSGWQKGPDAASQAAGIEPARHQVQRGETAFTIARAYNVSARDLAAWNGLDANLTVREGQYLLIPITAPAPTAVAAVTAPGAGTPTPVPPSAALPLPAQDEPPAAAAKAAAGIATPAPKPVVDLGSQRSTASASKLGMPVSGQIIRGYAKGKNEGIDIGASAGANVAAAGDGTVAAITKNTDGVPIMVIRHADNLLTVYGGIDALTVQKGAAVKRGQTIAKVRAGSPAFLHFEVRKGFDSVDPMTYLQ
ncbi:MAG: M23 family metallopeptidase [Gemmobacter sp.]|nr:M23 family metallopeptidase [Gemmobacter sp.]